MLPDILIEDYVKRWQTARIADAWPSPLPPGETLDDIISCLSGNTWGAVIAQSHF